MEEDMPNFFIRSFFKNVFTEHDLPDTVLYTGNKCKSFGACILVEGNSQ